jgi:hypothetical protein
VHPNSKQANPDQLALSRRELLSRQASQGHNNLALLSKLANRDRRALSKQEHPNRLDNRDPQGHSRQANLDQLDLSRGHRSRLVNRGLLDPNKPEHLSKQAKLGPNRPISQDLAHHNKLASSDRLGPSKLRLANLDRQLHSKLDNNGLLLLNRLVKQDLLVLSKVDSQDLAGPNRQASPAQLHLNKVASLGSQLLKVNQEANLPLVLEELLLIQW